MRLWTFMYKFLYEHMFTVLQSIYLVVELMGHVVILCLTFWETTKLFSKAAVPFCIPTSSFWEFQSLHILNNTCYCSLILAIPVGVMWYLIVVLVCITSVTKDVGHLLCLLAICIFSLEECLFKTFAHF